MGTLCSGAYSNPADPRFQRRLYNGGFYQRMRRVRWLLRYDCRYRMFLMEEIFRKHHIPFEHQKVYELRFGYGDLLLRFDNTCTLHGREVSNEAICERAMLRPGNAHSAERWKELLGPIVRRYKKEKVRKYFRGDAAFAKPEVYWFLEEKGFLYAIRLPVNDVLNDVIKPLLTRPVGRPPRKPIVRFDDFLYRASTWDKACRVVAKVEWHQGELCPRVVGFVVTNMSAKPEGVVHFNNGRGTAEQWIKEGKYALNWTRLSCRRFVENQVRLALFVLAYNLGNFLRRLVLPRNVKHWSLRSLLVKLTKIGAKVV